MFHIVVAQRNLKGNMPSQKNCLVRFKYTYAMQKWMNPDALRSEWSSNKAGILTLVNI